MPPAPVGQLVLGRDYVLDATSRRASDNGVVLFSSLPSLSKLKKDPKERGIVLRFKLLQCSYIFQFVKKDSSNVGSKAKDKSKDDDLDAPAKKAKLKAFDEILHLINQKSFVPFEAPIVMQIMDTLAANLFVTFPPIFEPPFYLVKSKPLWKERPPEVLHDPLPGWIHREKAYTLFLRLLQRCVESVQHGPMKRILSECITDRFLRRLLDLYMSPDNREREMLTNILLTLYVHFTGLRVVLQTAIKDVLCRFVSERLWTEHRAATEIASTVNLSAEIVNMQGFGFGYHQKSTRTEVFLAKVVLPLYQADAECVSRYSQQLFSLVNRCVFKQPALVQLTVTSLLRSWPRQCTFKQGIFLNQLTGLFLCLESAQREMAEERKPPTSKETNSRSRASIKSLDMGRESMDSPPPPPKRPSHKSLDLTSGGAASPRSGRSGSNETRKERHGSKDRKPSEDESRPSSPRDQKDPKPDPSRDEPRGSFKNLPGIFMHVEEAVNPFDFVAPVAEPLFKKLLECISHSQACVSQAAIQMLSLPAVTNFCLRDETLRASLVPRLYHALSQVSSHPFQSLRQTIVHLMLLLERAGGSSCPLPSDEKADRDRAESVRKRNERWDSVERLSQLQSLKKDTNNAAGSWNLTELADIDGLDALLKKYIAENDDETQQESSESSSDSDEDEEDRAEVPKPDLNSLKIVPPRSRAVMMVRNGSKQGNTVSDLMAATPTRRVGFGSPTRTQGFWRASRGFSSPPMTGEEPGILDLDPRLSEEKCILIAALDRRSDSEQKERLSDHLSPPTSPTADDDDCPDAPRNSTSRSLSRANSFERTGDAANSRPFDILSTMKQS